MSKTKGDFTMIYGYSRVSTKGQAKDGNSLESQEKALREAGATKIFTDAFNYRHRCGFHSLFVLD